MDTLRADSPSAAPFILVSTVVGLLLAISGSILIGGWQTEPAEIPARSSAVASASPPRAAATSLPSKRTQIMFYIVTSDKDAAVAAEVESQQLLGADVKREVHILRADTAQMAAAADEFVFEAISRGEGVTFYITDFRTQP